MSTSGSSGSAEHGNKRRSLFALPSLNWEREEAARHPRKTIRKQENPKLFTTLEHANQVDLGISSAPLPSESPNPRRPSMSTMRGSVKRPSSSVFGSLRSMRSSGDHADLAPFTTISTKAPSVDWTDGVAHGKKALHFGDVGTSTSLFRKKREFLVLTDTHIIRFKNQTRAAEVFSDVTPVLGRSPTIRHGSMPSVGSEKDLQTLSDSSSEKDGRIPLRQVVAVTRLDDGKPYYAIDCTYLDEESSQASTLTMQLNTPEERDTWLRRIRAIANDARLRDCSYISTWNLENAARIIERDKDYDQSNCAIYKVVQRRTASKSSGRSSSDDLSKVASTVCYLAIGVHKVHLVQLVKAVARTLSPSLTSNTSQGSYGILTMTSVKVSQLDDSIEVSFRQPMQRPKILYLASLAAYEIAARLHFAENFLRPECGYRLFHFNVPSEVEDMVAPPVPSDGEEHSCLDRTLIAYCVAYGVNPAKIRYTVNYICEDGPRFELLKPADARRPEYEPLECLAVMRALRYNESFGSMSFADIRLDCLNGLHDTFGQEQVCLMTKRGTPIHLSAEELGRSCLLVQEIRALAATSKKLRRMDFSGCVISKPAEPTDMSHGKTKDIGCGVVEALFPLCRHQTTNVDWIALNGITLSETDLDYLVGAAVEKSCHFRAIELNRCGLTDRTLGLVLDSFRPQDNTLEAIAIAGNPGRLNPAAFDSQISVFGFIRRLNLSYMPRMSGTEPLLPAETLLIWKLEEVRLTGTNLNEKSIEALATYLQSPKSDTLHELHVDYAYLSGGEIATLLRAMAREDGTVRDMLFDISQNTVTKDHEQLTQAIADGLTPSRFSMRGIEYRDETHFRRLLSAFAKNRSTRCLDISQTYISGDAGDETCEALGRLLSENNVLEELDISGEDSRLATSRFGHGINNVLRGLEHNKTLISLRIERQKLGLEGASTLADVLKENRTLRELHCDNNEVPLAGLTDLVNALIENTTLVYLPAMNDGRAAAFKSAEMTMKGMGADSMPALPLSPPSSKPPPAFKEPSSFGVRRSLASVRRNAARTASAYTPSFPALPSYNRSSSSPTTTPSPLSFSTSTRSRQNSQSSVSALVNFTAQDIQTTHRLLSEQWDRQVYRLSQYLERNWCILQGLPVNMEIEDEKFERPESVGSITKVLEQVKFDTTPRAEKEVYFDSPLDEMSNSELTLSPKAAEKAQVSFKQFLLGSGSSNREDVGSNMKELSLDENQKASLEEPRTPTQTGFSKI